MKYFLVFVPLQFSDDQGRYSFKSQPEICKWNLLKFAEAIKESLPFERSEAALEDL